MLREDIKIIPPGRHGVYTMIFDPVSEAYYKISPLAARIIAKLDRDYDLEEFHGKLKRLGLFISLEELNELVFFLAGNNLIAPEYGRYEQKRQQTGTHPDEKASFIHSSTAFAFQKGILSQI